MRIEELKNEEEEEDVESIYTKYLERAIWRRRQWAHNHFIYYFNSTIVGLGGEMGLGHVSEFIR